MEIFGLTRYADDKHRLTNAIKLLASNLNVNYDDVQDVQVKGNGVLVRLQNSRQVNEWETRSRELRLNLSDITKVSEEESDNKIKVFAAAPTRLKLLLHTVRKHLPQFKYIWIGKRGVMVRRESRSQIYVIKSENDIEKLS